MHSAICSCTSSHGCQIKTRDRRNQEILLSTQLPTKKIHSLVTTWRLQPLGLPDVQKSHTHTHTQRASLVSSSAETHLPCMPHINIELGTGYSYLRMFRGCHQNLPRRFQNGTSEYYTDSLWDGRYGNRIPMGARFSASGKTGPRAYPASCTRILDLFPGGTAARAWC